MARGRHGPIVNGLIPHQTWSYVLGPKGECVTPKKAGQLPPKAGLGPKLEPNQAQDRALVVGLDLANPRKMRSQAYPSISLGLVVCQMAHPSL
ncbi:hypothetical protein AMTR_s00176p00047900 [Amborella trichopoda]|uniref:Uncharacterized protein n=1 Tax=Amborella trichopoda TaxID=13333 RepID=W1PMY3_AMBTC|nr:hypothetical protein AMTR_s00176p00047900 [Amborella trichopoda]